MSEEEYRRLTALVAAIKSSVSGAECNLVQTVENMDTSKDLEDAAALLEILEDELIIHTPDSGWSTTGTDWDVLRRDLDKDRYDSIWGDDDDEEEDEEEEEEEELEDLFSRAKSKKCKRKGKK